MIPAFKESKRQDKQAYQIKLTRINYDQKSMSIFFLLKLNEKVKIASDKH